jgi:hypothetical protein
MISFKTNGKKIQIEIPKFYELKGNKEKFNEFSKEKFGGNDFKLISSELSVGKKIGDYGNFCYKIYQNSSFEWSSSILILL